jgi:hypothetical protein
MNKMKIELINTCPSCAGYEDVLRDIKKQFPEEVDLKIYYAGKDFEYLPKYGPIFRGTMVINEKDRYEDLSRKTIEEAVAKALGTGL